MYLRGVVDGNSGGVKFTLCSGGGGGSGDGDVDENGLADYLHAKRWMKGMLQDHARNEKYQHAISAAVADWKREHGHAVLGPVVMDIGAGTGLLSMLAAKAGASQVVGCEMFGVLASLARRIVAANRPTRFPTVDVSIVNSSSMELRSRVNPRRLAAAAAASTEVEATGATPAPSPTSTDGRAAVVVPAADVVVCELFDTVLIAEGIVPVSYTHLTLPTIYSV